VAWSIRATSLGPRMPALPAVCHAAANSAFREGLAWRGGLSKGGRRSKHGKQHDNGRDKFLHKTPRDYLSSNIRMTSKPCRAQQRPSKTAPRPIYSIRRNSSIINIVADLSRTRPERIRREHALRDLGNDHANGHNRPRPRGVSRRGWLANRHSGRNFSLGRTDDRWRRDGRAEAAPAGTEPRRALWL
jgi:hypothetical protein